MKIGYARISTKDQSFDLQVDALESAGCEQIYQEVVSGAKSERKALDKLLHDIRRGDVLVVWKLDRLGRSLRHLVDLVNDLVSKGVGLQSLNDPIDTTTSQGRLIFNLFACLAEFERDLLMERTQAGLKAARGAWSQGGPAEGHSQGFPAHGDRGRDPVSRRTAECEADIGQVGNFQVHPIQVSPVQEGADWAVPEPEGRVMVSLKRLFSGRR